MNKYRMGWDEVEELVDNIAIHYDFRKVTNLYGLPRGGLIPAVMLSHRTGIPLSHQLTRGTLIVDDIYDTGQTLNRYLDKNFKAVTLVNKLNHERLYSAKQINDWIVFPWETENSSKVDYLTK